MRREAHQSIDIDRALPKSPPHLLQFLDNCPHPLSREKRFAKMHSGEQRCLEFRDFRSKNSATPQGV
jgi:hypothetical protein